MSFRSMPRRWSSLLALLLLALSGQAAADGDDDDEDHDDEDDGRDEDGEDGKNKGKGRDHDDRDDDRDEDASKDDDEDEKDDRGDDGDRRKGKGGKARPSHGGGGMQESLAQDASLQILPIALPGRVQFSFLVTNGRPEPVTLAVDLPDVGGGTWALSGPGASSCDLRGLRLGCDLGDLAAGEVLVLQASAPIGRAPPWELVAEGTLATGAGPDAVPGNDAAAGRIGLLLR